MYEKTKVQNETRYGTIYIQKFKNLPEREGVRFGSCLLFLGISNLGKGLDNTLLYDFY